MAEEAVATEHAEPALRLRGVGRRFGGLHAVREVDLAVAPSERRAVLGPNGAGKTTLFNVIAGDLPASSGRVELFGRDVTAMPARARAKLGLDREITLILIEHDMDVALRVAERVTMMHDGRVIVEGTPEEIRANELVHDLYLGTGFRND